MAAAKRLVFGKVGIDMIAGPSEVLILADETGHPDWIAADLLAQAEHDASAQAILITDQADLADAVEQAVAVQLASLPRAAIAGASWRHFGAVILVGALADAVPLVDAIAPEHLEIESKDAEHLAGRIRNAGAICLGAHTPEAIGDYVGGSNHVLPTARSARFSSGLGVLDFMKRTSILDAGPISCKRSVRRRSRSAKPKASTPMPARWRCASIRDDPFRHASEKSRRLVAVTLDENSIGRSNPDVEHERAVAIYDLLEENTFAPNGGEDGPFALHLNITGSRLVFDIKRDDGAPVMAHLLSLSPLRRIVKDYFTVCDSYYAAIRTATPTASRRSTWAGARCTTRAPPS